MNANGVAELTRTPLVGLPNVGSQTEVYATAVATRGSLVDALKRRWAREKRRRKVGRAYDMALEIARLVPQGSEVLDVGCGNGFIAHHLSAMLGTSVIGIDVTDTTDAPIDFRHLDGERIPLADHSADAVLLCYVLHHAQDVSAVMNEIRRVLRAGGQVIIYEDIPATSWDKGVCWIHNQQWKGRTGPCSFRDESQWRELFRRSGFEVCSERSLSRARNLTHPVKRRLSSLRTVTARSATLPANPCSQL